MTIKEYFAIDKIDLDFIERKFTGPYWESCYKFLKYNWETDTSTLTQKQAAWISKILDDCVEKRIEG